MPGKQYERLHAKIRQLDPDKLRGYLVEQKSPYTKDPIKSALAGLRWAYQHWKAGDFPSYDSTAIAMGDLDGAFLWADHPYGQPFWEAIHNALWDKEQGK